MDFRIAKANFFRAARTGMATSLDWEGELWSAPNLVLKKLLPVAEAGLYAHCDKAAFGRHDYRYRYQTLWSRVLGSNSCVGILNFNDFLIKYSFRRFEHHYQHSTREVRTIDGKFINSTFQINFLLIDGTKKAVSY